MAFIGSCATPEEKAEISEVRKAINDAGYRGTTLAINERGGVVTISGTVEIDEDRNRIVEAAEGVPGVTEVIDLISTNDQQRLPEDATN